MREKGKRDWGRLLTRAAMVLGIGGAAAALVASLSAGQGLWHFHPAFTVLRYAFFAAGAGAVLGLIGLFLTRRRPRLMLANLVTLVIALGFVLYLGNLVRIARSVPAIHDVSTNLDDLPQFTRLPVRADNLEKVPDEGKPELKALPALERWKAVHRQHYGDLRTVRLAVPPQEALRRAWDVARRRGWQIAYVEAADGVFEATDTSRFFRFKDDVVVRVRPAPGGGSLLDMRSISRVGGSDVGMNAKRIREFLADLQRQG